MTTLSIFFLFALALWMLNAVQAHRKRKMKR